MGGRDGHDDGGRARRRHEEQLERVVSENVDLTRGLGWQTEAEVPEIRHGRALQDGEFASR